MLNTTSPHELPVYQRLPVALTGGHDLTVEDQDGECYLDLYGGHAVQAVGHGHPRVVEAIRRQSEALLFYSNAVTLPVRDRLHELLVQMTPASLTQAFLLNSGAEANEQALAIARRHTGRKAIVALDGGFHGRTLATLAASGIQRFRALAEQGGAGGELLAATRLCPFNDLGALQTLVTGDVAAVILEPVQGLAGARACDPAFLRGARQLCDARGALLIFDEVQCGCGRIGAFTAAERFGVTPDVLTLAKALGSGLPISALLTHAAIAARIGPGDLGTTFGGGPVPAAAAVATLEILEDGSLFAHALAREAELRERLASVAWITGVSGAGLLLGVHCDGPAREVQRHLFGERVLTGLSQDPTVLRLLPPLTLASEHVDRLLEALATFSFTLCVQEVSGS